MVGSSTLRREQDPISDGNSGGQLTWLHVPLLGFQSYLFITYCLLGLKTLKPDPEDLSVSVSFSLQRVVCCYVGSEKAKTGKQSTELSDSEFAPSFTDYSPLLAYWTPRPCKKHLYLDIFHLWVHKQMWFDGALKWLGLCLVHRFRTKNGGQASA